MRKYKEGKYTIWKYDDGSKVWRINGKWHREDGPANERADGSKEWWLNGKRYTEKEWRLEMRKKKLKVLGL